MLSTFVCHPVGGPVDPSGTSASKTGLVLDPQTSGGLLAAVDPAVVDGLVAAGFWLVGAIEAGEPAVMLR